MALTSTCSVNVTYINQRRRQYAISLVPFFESDISIQSALANWKMTTGHFASVKMIVVICVICALIDGGTSLSQEETTLISAEGRTFGHHFLKRLSFAVIPAAFVVGVMTSLLAMLTVMSMKGLGIGVLLLILGLSQVLSRAFHHSLPVSSPYPIVYSHHSRSDQSHVPVWTKEDLATGPYSAYGN